MIGKKSFFLARKIFFLARFFRFITFRWDETNLVLQGINPITKIFGKFTVIRLGWKITNTMSILAVPFAIFRTIYGALVLEQTFQDVMFQVFISNVYLLGGIVAGSNLIRHDPIPYLFTLFLRFERKLTRTYQFKTVRDESLPYLLVLGILAFGEAPALTILYLLNWNKPVYLGSLLLYVPKDMFLTRIIAFLFFFFIEIMLIFGVILGALTYAFVLIIYWQGTKRWLKQMTVGLNTISKRKVTKDDMREPNTVLQIYRQWQINLIVLNETIDFVLWSQHFVTASLLILCLFSTIEFYGPQNFESIFFFITYAIYPVASVIFLIWIVMILPLGAEIKVESHRFKFYWKNYHKIPQNIQKSKITSYDQIRDKFFYKSMYSCNELEIHIGMFFSYNKSSMPQTLDDCIDNTITLLLGV